METCPHHQAVAKIHGRATVPAVCPDWHQRMPVGSWGLNEADCGAPVDDLRCARPTGHDGEHFSVDGACKVYRGNRRIDYGDLSSVSASVAYEHDPGGLRLVLD